MDCYIQKHLPCILFQCTVKSKRIYKFVSTLSTKSWADHHTLDFGLRLAWDTFPVRAIPLGLFISTIDLLATDPSQSSHTRTQMTMLLLAILLMTSNNLSTPTVFLASPPNTADLKTPLPVFKISIGETHLEQVDHFPYLGNILSSNCTAEKDVDHRIGAAHTAFGKLYKRVFKNKDLSRTTKLMVFKVVVISTPLYGCEAWRHCSRRTWRSSSNSTNESSAPSSTSNGTTTSQTRPSWSKPTLLVLSPWWWNIASAGLVTSPGWAMLSSPTKISSKLLSGWRQSISTGTAMFAAEWRRKADEKRAVQKRGLAAPRPPPARPPVPSLSSQILRKDWPAKPTPRPSKKRRPYC